MQSASLPTSSVIHPSQNRHDIGNIDVQRTQSTADVTFSSVNSAPDPENPQKPEYKKIFNMILNELAINLAFAIAINIIGGILIFAILNVPPSWPIIGIFMVVGTIAPVGLARIPKALKSLWQSFHNCLASS